MARITSILSCLHSVVVQVPEHGYHNISRIVQPQIRSVCDVLAGQPQASQEQQQQESQLRKTPATTAAAEARNANLNLNAGRNAKKP